MNYLIIPDIHGQAGKLDSLLSHLGWRRTPAGWTGDGGAQEIVFLGDFIDRGPENARVLRTVRSLIDAGKAQAVMGNHELNAIHFHTIHPENGTPLREHSGKNLRQHASFLAEFPLGSAAAKEAIAWMRGLPLFLEFDSFRAVHACWDEAEIATLTELSEGGRLSDAQFQEAASKGSDLYRLLETTAKGPEAKLPDGHFFRDKNREQRRHVRLQWWRNDATDWRDLAASVPNPAELPTTPVPEAVRRRTYPRDAKPVFFGHYWMTGVPALQAPNALCLDYSAGEGGPLLAYRVEGDGAHRIDLANIVSAPGAHQTKTVSD